MRGLPSERWRRFKGAALILPEDNKGEITVRCQMSMAADHCLCPEALEALEQVPVLERIGLMCAIVIARWVDEDVARKRENDLPVVQQRVASHQIAQSLSLHSPAY